MNTTNSNASQRTKGTLFPKRSHFLPSGRSPARLQRVIHAASMGRGFTKCPLLASKCPWLRFPTTGLPHRSSDCWKPWRPSDYAELACALIMWRSGLRISETVALEWRDVDVEGGTLLVRRVKGRTGRTVPLHPHLASLFANWPISYGPRDTIVGLTRKTALRHLRAGIEHAGLDEESPGTGRQKAGAHSLRHSAARHWLTTAAVPLNVVSSWLGHANPEVTLRIYLPIVVSTHTMADVP